MLGVDCGFARSFLSLNHLAERIEVAVDRVDVVDDVREIGCGLVLEGIKIGVEVVDLGINGVEHRVDLVFGIDFHTGDERNLFTETRDDVALLADGKLYDFHLVAVIGLGRAGNLDFTLPIGAVFGADEVTHILPVVREVIDVRIPLDTHVGPLH